MSTTYIPVNAEEWVKMVQATKVAAELLVENERLRKAGDAMYQAAMQDSTGIWLHPAFKAWKEIK